MGQTTSRLGLYLPGGGSTGTITPDEAADIDKINDNMSKIDAAAGATVCTSGTRPSSPYNGKLIFETDTNYVRVWDSATSTWDLVGGSTYPATNLTGLVPIANGGTNASTDVAARTNLKVGLTKIVPTAVTFVGGTGSTSNGVTTFTSCTGISLQGVFSAEFNTYRIVYVAGSTVQSNPTHGRLMSGTTIDTSSGWAWGLLTLNSTALTFGGGSNSTNYFIVAGTGISQNDTLSIVELSSPFLSGIKAFHTQYTVNGSTSSRGSGTGGGSASKDGVHIFVSSGNITGQVVVYGYNQ